MRERRIDLDGLYGNELTALCRPEELLRLCRLRAADLPRIRPDDRLGDDQRRAGLHLGHRAGVGPERRSSTCRSARTTCTASDTRSSSGAIGRSTGCRPRGRERLLCWMAGKAYSWFHGSRVGHDSRDDSQHDPFFEYLDELVGHAAIPTTWCRSATASAATTGRPIRSCPSSSSSGTTSTSGPKHGDLHHQPVDARLRGALRRPDSRGPRRFHALLGRRRRLVGRETAMTRTAAERLVQAEALWAMLRSDKYPVGRVLRGVARRAALQRTHLGCALQYQPAGQPVHAQPMEDQAGVRRGRPGASRATCCRTRWPAPPRRRTKVTAVDVWNTTSWPRTRSGHGCEPSHRWSGDVVKDREGTWCRRMRDATRSTWPFWPRRASAGLPSGSCCRKAMPEPTGDAQVGR